MKRGSKSRYLLLMVLLAVLLLLKYCRASGTLPVTTVEPEPVPDTVATLHGAAANLLRVDVAGVRDSTIHIKYDGFEVYFSPRYHVPRCTVYEFTKSELYGKASRENVQFRDDENVPSSAWSSDYTGSGYTRGHMTPAGDLKWSQRALEQSFKMTNICPQLKGLNEGAWGDLENKVREWVKRDKGLIVITGPVLTPGMKTIGRHKVAVPKRFFKVVLAHKVQPMRAIAFLYDHKDVDMAPLSAHAVSVDSVEALTSLDFFTALPVNVQATLEADTNIDKWLY